MNSTFNKLTAQRRSIYALGDQLTNSPEEIYDLIITAIKNSPTAFNSQTVRAVVLFGKSSDKVWDIVEVALKEVVKDPQAFAKTQQKIASFRAGFGTVLFLTETDTVHELEKQFPAYADNFADWATQNGADNSQSGDHANNTGDEIGFY